MAFNTYGSGNYEGIAQASEPLLKWLLGGVEAARSQDRRIASCVVCGLLERLLHTASIIESQVKV